MVLAFLKRHHRRIMEIGAGLVLYEGFNFVFDFLFYPFAIAYWGILKGGYITFMCSLVINIAVFWLYEFMRVDWLGAHALRELEDKENKSNFEKLATWFAKEKVRWWEKLLSPIVFITLLLPIDPVIVAIHYQKKHFQGIGWRDWGILFLATAIANAWWLVKISLVVEGLKFVWEKFF